VRASWVYRDPHAQQSRNNTRELQANEVGTLCAPDRHSERHNMTDSDAVRVAGHIMQYLHAHEEAADTMEGILAWWLDDMPRPSLRTVRDAMALLVAAGDAEQQTLPDGTIVYRGARGSRPVN
jgi:hypothetical protein